MSSVAQGEVFTPLYRERIPDMMSLFVNVLIWALSTGAAVSKPDVNFGVLLPFKGEYPWALPVTLPSIEYAVESISRTNSILRNHNLRLTVKDSQCSETYGPLAAINMMVEKSANVFIGPACDYAVAPIARFSHDWGIPLITAGGLVSAFKDKRQYKLLTRIQGSYEKAGDFFVTMCQNFNWKKVGLVYHDYRTNINAGKSDCFFTMEAMFVAVRNYLGVRPWFKSFDQTSRTTDFKRILEDTSKEVRIVVLCGSPDSIRKIMLAAEELKLDNGDYVFINIDIFGSKNQIGSPWYRGTDTEEENARAKKAFEAMLTITMRKPTSIEYSKFSEEVKKRARENYENFTYSEEDVNSFVGAFHDAVILYAIALNETLAAGGNITDGAGITRRMWNRTFEGVAGTVSIDANGDRNADYSLLDLDPKTGTFQVVADYYGTKKVYEPVTGREIHWAGGRASPPPDTPACGFDGSLCPSDEPVSEYVIVIIVLAVVLVIVLVAAFVMYRYLKPKSLLEKVKWKNENQSGTDTG